MRPVVRSYRGRRPRIHPGCFIAENAAVVGDVEIAAEASIWYSVTLRGDGNAIRIGTRTNIQDNTVVHVDRPVHLATTIGDGVTVGHACIIHACTLQDRAFVGMGSTVLDGSVIESEGMLAAHSLLPLGKVIRSGEVWAGVPARRWRTLRDDEYEMMNHIREVYWQTARDFLADMDTSWMANWPA